MIPTLPKMPSFSMNGGTSHFAANAAPVGGGRRRRRRSQRGGTAHTATAPAPSAPAPSAPALPAGLDMKAIQNMMGS